MTFNVTIQVEIQDFLDCVIQKVIISGESAKPSARKIPGAVSKYTDRCHVIACSVLKNSIVAGLEGKTVRQAATATFLLSPQEIAQIKNENVLRAKLERHLGEVLHKQQKKVSNYYNGLSDLNQAGGREMSAATIALKSLFNNESPSSPGFKEKALKYQVDYARSAYDASKHHTESEKILSRGEYIVRLFQINTGSNAFKVCYLFDSSATSIIENFVNHGVWPQLTVPQVSSPPSPTYMGEPPKKKQRMA